MQMPLVNRFAFSLKQNAQINVEDLETRYTFCDYAYRICVPSASSTASKLLFLDLC